MNFRIVEDGDDAEYLNKIYPRFKKDFLNPEIKVNELREKYNLTQLRYLYLREKVLTETGLTEKPASTGGRRLGFTQNTFITQNKNGKYCIYKNINGFKQYFGSYNNLDTARKVRDILMENNWDSGLYSKLQKKYSSNIKSSSKNALKKYREFKELYLRNNSRKSIRESLKLSNYQYEYLAGLVCKEYNVARNNRGKIIKI